ALASGVITTVAGTGAAGSSGDGGPAVAAKLSAPQGVATGHDGSVLVADTGNHKVRRVAPNGTITTMAGTGSPCANPRAAWGDGGPAVAAKLSAPTGVAGASDGSVYVADTGDHRIRAVGVNGTIVTVAGTGVAGTSGEGGPATAAQLNHPRRAVVA